MIILDQSQRKCPYCGATIVMRRFRLYSDSCPNCGRLGSSAIGMTFKRPVRFLLTHWRAVCLSFAVIVTGWFGLAYYAYERALPLAGESLMGLMPPYRMLLAPLDPHKPPMIRLSFTQFLANPFRRTVTVEVVHFQEGWIPMVLELDDNEVSEPHDSNG